MSEPEYTEFEQGERQALLQVRSFIAKHGIKEVSDYAAMRLHDIRMDALHRTEQAEGDVLNLVVNVAALTEPRGYITYRTKSGAVTSAFGDPTKGISMPPRATLLAAGLVGPNTPQPPTAKLHSISTETLK